MPQSKKRPRNDTPSIHLKSNHRISKLQRTAPPRRSARLQQLAERATPKSEREHAHHELPSPSPTVQPEKPHIPKRKRSSLHDASVDEQPPSKRPQGGPAHLAQATRHPLGSITQWASTGHWSATEEAARAFEEEYHIMSQAVPSRQSSGKRKSSSVHRADRIHKLSRHGISMELSDELDESSKERCETFLAGDRIPRHFPGYSPKQAQAVLQRVQDLNEGRLHRDVTPWVAPSAEHAYWNGETTLKYLVDEVEAEWTRCAPMGSTRPKPDLTVGLSPDDFTEEEIRKLESYSSLGRPYFVTPNLCYPFFVAEAKSGEEGLNKADRQNVHSAAIAVNAILELQKAAFETSEPDRVKELYRKPLVFSMSHNGRQANLYAHFAVPSIVGAGEFTIQRYEIEMASFFKRKGVDRYKPYNFTLNIYETVGQEHRKMIKNAVAALPAPSGLSFVTSGWTINTDSQEDSREQNEPVSQDPSENVAKLVQELRETQEKAERMERLIKQLKEQVEQQK